MYNLFMDIKQYTDIDYIPISELSSMGDSFVSKTLEYRQKFMEIIKMDNLGFVNIVETPALVKKRYKKNIEIKDFINFDAKDHDYIKKIALMIINDEEVDSIPTHTRKNIIKKYKENNKDLTIITSWLIENVDIFIKSKEDISYAIPELSAKDINYINKFNNKRLNYSINDYISLNRTSYETGRRSLEKMVSLGLYIKTKLGKKFVYKPTVKLISITKGGK